MTQFRSATAASCFAAEATRLASEESTFDWSVGIEFFPPAEVGWSDWSIPVEFRLDWLSGSAGNDAGVEEVFDRPDVTGAERAVVVADLLVEVEDGLGSVRVVV